MTSSVNDALAKLRNEFAAQLSSRLDVLRALFLRLSPLDWNTGEAEELHRLLHSLTGSAGTFGMQSVSSVARALETRLAVMLRAGEAPSEATWQAFSNEMGRLDVLARIRLDTGGHSLLQPDTPIRLNHNPLIFLMEDDPEQAAQLSLSLQHDGYRVRVFSDADTFRKAFTVPEAEQADAVVMDMILTEGDTAGAKLIAELKAANIQCPPVIFVSVRDDLEARLAAFRAGARRYMAKPVDTPRLIDLLDNLTGRQPLQPYRVLMVDDDALTLEAQANVLRAAGMEVRTLSQPLQILQRLHDFTPDVVILDVYMPGASGPELAAVLREREAQMQVPILFLSAESDMTQQLLSLSLGGDDFLVKPVQPDHLLAAVNARARRARQNSVIQQRLYTNLYEREREHLALNHHAIVSIADQAGNITYVNGKFCEVSGYSADELMGKNHRILKSGEHAPEYYAQLWRTIAAGEVWHGEICNRRKDGSLYWVESTITPFLDADDKPYQYVSIRTDISHVKSTEAALRKSSERLNQAQKVAQLGSFEWFPASGELKWSDEHFRLWGLQPDAVTPSFALFIQAVHKDDRNQLEEALRRAMEQRTPFDCIYRLELPDGSARVMHSRGEYSFDDSGQAIKLAGTVQDVTARMRAEQEAESSKERLRRGQFFANIGTWEWNIQSGELFWTERIAPLFGYPAGDLETSYDNFLAAIHPDDRQAVIDAVGACIEHDTPYNIEHRVVWPDGTVRWLLERGGVKRDADGNALQMLGVVQDIDDRKRAELALAERERQLRDAQTLAHFGNWSVELASGKLVWSDEIYRIFGYQPGAIQPNLETFHAAVHPEDQALVRASEQRAEKSGRHDVVHRIVRPDGTVRHVHELAQAENDNTGKLASLSGTVQDITERIQSEARLRETEERFAFAVEGAGDGVWDWNMRSNAMQFSRPYMKMLGYAEHELPHHLDTWVNSVHGDDLAHARQQLQDYLEGRLPNYSIELRLRCKDGSYKWILCRGTIVSRDNDGKPLRMIGIHSNITERKLMQEQLTQQKKLLDMLHRATTSFVEKADFSAAMNDMLDTLLELTGSEYGFTGEVLHDATGAPYLKTHAITNIAWNPATQAFYDEHKMQGLEFRNLDTLFGHVMTSRNTVVSNLPAADPRSGGLPQGHPAMHAFLGVPIFYGEELVGMFGIANRAGGYDDKLREFLRPFDTTYGALIHSKRMIEKEEDNRSALVEAKREADRANQTKSEFLSSMSHELRTPMNAILGFGQLMQYDDTLSPEQQDNVEEIIKAGNHLLTLINEILDLAKVESGRIDLSLEPVDVTPVIEECLSLVQTLADKRDIRISYRELQGAAVRADRTRLMQVLLNLLSNAIKYNRAGGNVYLEVQYQGTERLRISVTDTGPGIAPGKLGELFVPFKRLDAEYSNIEGTGIGLTITRRIIELMAGTVDVESELGVGSTFWIELPVDTVAVPAFTAEPEYSVGEAAQATHAETARHTVLYIEDNPANLRLVAQILGQRKHIHLLTAHTPELGIELALLRQPELILLDINMPGMDGYQVLKILQAEASLANIPIVAVTANAMPRDIARGMAAGFTDYLTKPLNVLQFNAVLDKLLLNASAGGETR